MAKNSISEICQISGCSNPVKVKIRGLCSVHYGRWYRTGDPEKKRINKGNTKHGHCHSKTWYAWVNMRRRCTDKTIRNYHRYGGRGISVCQRWLIFQNFLDDMGVCPDGLTLDRINNDGDYTPDNCEWVTFKVNVSKRCNTVFYDEINKKMALALIREGKSQREVASIMGCSQSGIWYLLQRENNGT